MNFTEEVKLDKAVAKATAFYINLNLEVNDIIFTPKFGLSVANTEPENALKLLKKMAEKGNTSALEVAVKSVRLGAEYQQSTEVEDSELDALLDTKEGNAPLLVGTKKEYDPVMFWIDYEVTSPYLVYGDKNPVIYTSSTSVSPKAPKAFLSALLKLSKDGGDIETEVTSVRDASVKREFELLDLDF